MVLRELLRLLDGLANRLFCWSDIWRVQLKSNWTVGKKILASDSKTVWKSRLILSKVQLHFFNGWLGNPIILKELALKEPMDDVMLHLGNCSDIQIALRTHHFVNQTLWGSNWSQTIFECPLFIFSKKRITGILI